GGAPGRAEARGVAARLGDDAGPVEIRTSGDRGATRDKSRFVREIEEALLAGVVDIAVRSAKDVPSELPRALAIVGVPEREDARDALCGAASLEELAGGAIVGTSSLRRRAQLLALRPDLRVRSLRGNVDTRLRRLEEGRFDAIVVAMAGLRRLGREAGGGPMSVEVLTPAPG